MTPGLQKLNHLLFADDCLIFIKAELQQIRNFMELVYWYEKVAGQKVNVDKSEFTYSPNLDNYMVTLFANSLGMF